MNKLVYRYIIRHYQYVSFDVFDTLIERDVNRPSDIFVLVGKCILGKENAEKFRILRKKAEFEAREENNHRKRTDDRKCAYYFLKKEKFSIKDTVNEFLELYK